MRPNVSGLIVALTAVAAALWMPVGQARADVVSDVLDQLNSDSTVNATDESKSYPLLFDAYLAMTPPPYQISEDFNLLTIYAGMPEWTSIAGWAEGNGHVAEAIHAASRKTIFGLPYGESNVEAKYREEALVAAVGKDGSLRDSEFTYLYSVDVICAYVAAETYRLCEAGQAEEAMKLAMANIQVLRQLCDRQFFAEKEQTISLLVESLSNLRDLMYIYNDAINEDTFIRIGFEEIPYLRPGRGFLFMPEGDRIVAEALIRLAFDDREQANPDRFREIFAGIQSRDEPLTRFGAAKRWALVAQLHASMGDSIDRLNLVYDDWWRRWRVQRYDAVLDYRTEYEATNPVRYAAVIYSMADIENLFAIRKNLIASVNATCAAAGLAGYYNARNTYPSQLDALYGRYMRKSMDLDPYSKEDLAQFRYRQVSSRTPIDTVWGRLWLDGGSGLLAARGQDFDDDRGEQHTGDGTAGDIVFWPPVRAIAREQGLLE